MSHSIMVAAAVISAARFQIFQLRNSSGIMPTGFCLSISEGLTGRNSSISKFTHEDICEVCRANRLQRETTGRVNRQTEILCYGFPIDSHIQFFAAYGDFNSVPFAWFQILRQNKAANSKSDKALARTDVK